MIRLLSVVFLGACLTTATAQTQDHPDYDAGEGVVLGGWNLPEGSVITSTTQLRRHAEVAYFPLDTDPSEAEPSRQLEIHTLRVDSLETTITSVIDGAPAGVEQFVAISDILEDVREEGRIIDQGRRPTPLSGTRFAADRAEDGSWRRRFIIPEDPSVDQLAALAQPFTVAEPQYPTWPVRVGETWEVERGDLEALFGSLVDGAPQRMTLRLDSTGTYMGRPAAFLTYSLDVVMDQGGGLIMRKHELGSTVRILDRFVDVLSQWQGSFRSIRDEGSADGERALMEGEIRGQRQQFISVPSRSAPPRNPTD